MIDLTLHNGDRLIIPYTSIASMYVDQHYKEILIKHIGCDDVIKLDNVSTPNLKRIVEDYLVYLRIN